MTDAWLDELLTELELEAQELFSLANAVVRRAASGVPDPDDLGALSAAIRSLEDASASLGIGAIHHLLHGLDERLRAARRSGVLDPLTGEIVRASVLELERLLGRSLACRDVGDPFPDAAEAEAFLLAFGTRTISPEPQPTPNRPRRLVRVEAGKLERLEEDISRLAHKVRSLDVPDRDVATLVDRLVAHARELSRVSLHTVMFRVRRLALDTATRLGRDVDLRIVDDGVEVERSTADHLFDPLLHIVKNAVTHGIEAPDERRDADKPMRGRVVITARRRGDDVLVTVEDDGRGVDGTRLGTTDDEALLDALSRPGFSTARVVSDLTGRGVGLDVVRRKLSELGGHVRMRTRPGRGTRFDLAVPDPLGPHR